MLGRTEYVEEAHIAAKDAFCLWSSHITVLNLAIFDHFKKTRAIYKYAIRHCKELEDGTKTERFATSIASKKL
jgi:hypothetical protein